MTLPKSPFTIAGGCNCGPIRYKVNVPEFEERPVLTYCDAHAISNDVRFPRVLIDHCNDCRRATGSLIGLVLCLPIPFLEFSVAAPYIGKYPADRSDIRDEGRKWTGGSEFLRPEDLVAGKHAPLKIYRSSPRILRGFCDNCGTMMLYRPIKFPEGWIESCDIWMGTFDKSDLEKEWMKPECELWWDMGIPWVREMVRDGTVKVDMPRHPQWQTNHFVE